MYQQKIFIWSVMKAFTSNKSNLQEYYSFH